MNNWQVRLLAHHPWEDTPPKPPPMQVEGCIPYAVRMTAASHFMSHSEGDCSTSIQNWHSQVEIWSLKINQSNHNWTRNIFKYWHVIYLPCSVTICFCRRSHWFYNLRLYVDYDLPHVPVGLHVSVSFGNVLQVEHWVNHRHHLVRELW